MGSTPDTPSTRPAWHWLYNPVSAVIDVDQRHPEGTIDLFLSRPLYAPLLFSNVSSDARDHCANERTFLSWLRLAVYMAIVSVAIFINFHLKHQPTPLEQSMSRPLGIVFWLLSLACLASGMANYMKTVTKYAGRRALVQSGIKTQVIFGVVATAIIAACALFLGAEAQATRMRAQAARGLRY